MRHRHRRHRHRVIIVIIIIIVDVVIILATTITATTSTGTTIIREKWGEDTDWLQGRMNRVCTEGESRGEERRALCPENTGLPYLGPSLDEHGHGDKAAVDAREVAQDVGLGRGGGRGKSQRGFHQERLLMGGLRGGPWKL